VSSRANCAYRALPGTGPEGVKPGCGQGGSRYLPARVSLTAERNRTVQRYDLPSVCPRGFEPPRPLRTTRPSTARVYHSNHEHIEPLSGADPDRLPYEGRIAAARNGMAAAPGASMTRRTKAGISGAVPSAAQDGCDLPCSR
jgi:hypothetical protein